MDNIIGNWRKRFDNLPLAQSVDTFLKLDLKNGEVFIKNFKDILKIDTTSLQAKSLIIKSMMEIKKGRNWSRKFEDEGEERFLP